MTSQHTPKTTAAAQVLAGGLAAIALLASATAPAQAAPAKKIVWQKSFESAMAAAKKSGKPVFVDFNAAWCAPCKALDAQVFPAAHVVKASQNYVMVKVDGDKRPDLAKKYVADAQGRIGYPVLAILSPSGKPVKVVRGLPLPAKYSGDAYKAASFELAKMLNANKKA